MARIIEDKYGLNWSARINCPICGSVLEITIEDLDAYLRQGFFTDEWEYYLDFCPACCEKHEYGEKNLRIKEDIIPNEIKTKLQDSHLRILEKVRRELEQEM